MISSEERLLYHNRSPYSMIRLEFGEEQVIDSSTNNKYTRAAATFNSWLKEGVLAQEECPAFYLVEHCFPYQDNMQSRWGLIARVKLENLGAGQIKAHEKTLSEPSIDRFNLLKSCHANFSPVMGMIHTQNGELVQLLRNLAKEEPILSAVDSYGVSYRLWVITATEKASSVSKFFDDKVIYIADGHHRYETALRYQQEQRASDSSSSEDEPYNFVMMNLMDSQDPGLVMLPTHRLVKSSKSKRELEEKLSRYLVDEDTLPRLSTFSETIQSWLQILRERKGPGTLFGIYGLRKQSCSLMRLRKDTEVKKLMSVDETGQNLDVSLLHHVILKTALGIDSPDKERMQLEYTRDELEAVARVDSGECKFAIFLNPTPIFNIIAAANTGSRLPQKATYFYPKTPAGLVINPLW
ncbi:DUF1015 domain-containing protein [Chloroflexota bacterium]